ncbi:hypothetical protein ACEPPN_010302 [Leptodophora sp. 'Broadleaf-Isolate-01']
MAPNSVTINNPRVTPIPIPNRSAVLNPDVDVLMTLGAVMIEDVGIDDCDVDEVDPETMAVVELDGIERGCDVDVESEETGRGVVDESCVGVFVLDEMVLPADGVATGVPLCTVEHNLKAFCLAVGTASTPVQRPSRIPKLIQAPDNVPSVSPEVLVAKHKHSSVGFEEHLLSGNCCSTEDFKHGCAQAGRKAETSDGRETEYAF